MAAPSVESRCLVYCRLRPETQVERELAEEEGRLMELNLKSVNVRGDKSYQFDGTFGGESTQEQLFESIGRPCVEHCLNGYRSALMAYGQTGTGKSFTMCCTKPGLEGIIPRAAQLLFDTIEKQSEERTFSIQLQFLQIYRDNLGDLMTETGKDRVDIFFDKNGVTLPGCSIHEVKNTNEFMEVYNLGNSRRVTTATAMNPESSRGHSALLVWVTSTKKNDLSSSERKGKITFIDLAGYERFSKTGISNANAIMKDEAKTINASLLSLGHVVSALSNGDKHIPWRNSKLTRLLQDSIGGRSRTTIILTVGPSTEHVFETTNTLQFGQRAMAVKVQAKTTETVDYERLAAKLQTLLNEKEERINALEVQAASFDVAKQDLLSRHERDLGQMRSEHQNEIEKLRSEGASDERILKIINQHEVERENLIEQQKEELEYNNEQNETTNKEIVDNLTSNFEAQMSDLRLRIQELEDLVTQKDRQLTSLKAKNGIHSATSSTGSSHTQTPRSPNMSQQSSENQPKSPPSGGLNLNDLTEGPALDGTIAMYGNSNEHLRLVNLQTEVSKLTTLCNQRAEDLHELNQYVDAIKRQFTESSAEGPSSTVLKELLESPPKVSAVSLVDSKVVEEMEKHWTDRLAEKEEEVEMLKQELTLARSLGTPLQPSLTPRARSGSMIGAAEVTPTPLSARGPRPMQRTRGLTVTQSSAVVEQQRIQIEMLREELENANAEIARLSEDVSAAAEGENVSAELEEARKTIQDLTTEMSVLRSSLEEKDHLSDTLKKEHKEAMEEGSALFGQLENTQSRCAELQKETDQKQQDIETLTMKLVDSVALAESLRAELEEAKKRNDESAALLSTNTELSANLDEARKNAADSQTLVATLTEQLAEAEKQKAEALSELALSRGALKDRTENETSRLLKEQRDLFTSLFAGDRNVMYVKSDDALKAQNSTLTAKLVELTTALNERRVEIEMLKDQLKHHGIEPKVSLTTSQITKIIENNDLALITAFKESELQLLHNRLELREKSMYDLANYTTQLTHYIIELRGLLQKLAPDATIPPLDVSWKYNGGDGEADLTFANDRQRKEAIKEAEAGDLIRAQLEGLLHLMKAMRKQNALLQTTVMERSIMLKHYVWMLMAQRALPHDFNPETIVGTIAADLRLAFAERDEELATRDQHLLQRSTELIVLEESVAELHSQLKAAGLVPCRPATKFAISTLRTREEMQDELSDRDAAKAKLVQQRISTVAEVSKVENEIAQLVKQPPTDETNVELLRLRSKSEQLRSSVEVIDAKIKSQEREIDMLQHLIAQSSRLVVELQAQRDLAVDLSVVEKFKARFLRK